MGTSELAETLRKTRSMKGLSLKAVADPADISATYLQKLERAEVHEPSPHVLYRLAQQLGLEYAQLMRLAGYVVPRPHNPPNKRATHGPISFALSSEPLTEEEAQALAEYLAFLRHKGGGRSQRA